MVVRFFLKIWIFIVNMVNIVISNDVVVVLIDLEVVFCGKCGSNRVRRVKCIYIKLNLYFFFVF